MHYPQGTYGIGGLGDISGAPFAYVPDLAPVGSGSAYFPRDVERDAAALNFLGFMSDVDDANRAISKGSQAADIAASAGGFDPAFRAAVTRFQASAGLTIDSWIGPKTRAGLLQAVASANLRGLGGGPVPTLPPAILPVNPGGVPVKPGPLPGIKPASAGTDADGDETTTYLAIGAGVLALAGLGWWALR